ncbi:spermatogenesis-associated protein 4 [Alligator mississippiensis]|uniref:Spermatogenesis-associated protein 4 n=1 Tax=Alligator mississippiensis TaxID=8496 RepID=A0A151PAN6_ALLMI|nr:spermatogenesis-associated protein 4 [Alligator mississippiensis]
MATGRRAWGDVNCSGLHYQTPPRRTGLPRAVLRWLQSLDLSFFPRRFGRDFANGVLVAEIFSWYFPGDLRLGAFQNGTSLRTKLCNWARLQQFFLKRKLNPVQELINGTMHCKPGAAEILVQDIYSMLTNRRIKNIQDEEVDFTDSYYQDQLPMVARSTASKAIKNNIKLTEEMIEPSIKKNRQKVNAIINMHMQQRLLEREENPKRFNIKPSLGERAVRHPSRHASVEIIINSQREKLSSMSYLGLPEIRRKTSVHFKEIQVKQADRSSLSVDEAQNDCNNFEKFIFTLTKRILRGNLLV